MPEVAIPWSNSSQSGRNRLGSLDRLVNLLPEANNNLLATTTDATSFVLVSAPGSRSFSKLIDDDSDVVRMYSVDAFLYAFTRKGVYRIFPNGTNKLLYERQFSRKVDVSDGVVYTNAGFRLNQIVFVDRGEVFQIDADSDTVKKISDPDLGRVSSVTHIANYMIYTRDNSDQFNWSDIADFASVKALSFATAEGASDLLRKVEAFEGDVLFFGAKTIEVWRLTGDVDQPFTRLSNATHEIGCAAGATVAKLTRDIYWVSDDLRVYRTAAQSYNYTPISLHTGVASDLAKYGAENAYSYVTTHEGHAFYHLVIPEAHRTWVFDEATEAWFERSSLQNGQIQQEPDCQDPAYGLHIGRSAVVHQGKAYLGGQGEIFEYTLDHFADGEESVMYEASTGNIMFGSDGAMIDRVRLDFQNHCDEYAEVKNNVVELSWSDDQGRKWKGCETKKLFHHEHGQVEFQRLGRSKQRAFRWRTFAEAQVVFQKAIINFQSMQHGRR